MRSPTRCALLLNPSSYTATQPADIEALKRAILLARVTNQYSVSQPPPPGGTGVKEQDLPADECVATMFSTQLAVAQSPYFTPITDRAPSLIYSLPLSTRAFVQLFLSDYSRFFFELHQLQSDTGTPVSPSVLKFCLSRYQALQVGARAQPAVLHAHTLLSNSFRWSCAQEGHGRGSTSTETALGGPGALLCPHQ